MERFKDLVVDYVADAGGAGRPRRNQAERRGRRRSCRCSAGLWNAVSDPGHQLVTLDISPSDLPVYQYKGDADLIRAGVINFGAGRITLSDVGRRAGASRMTVYDRFGNLHDLMRALIPGAKRTELLPDLENTRHGAIAPPSSGHQTLPSWQ